MPTDRRHDRIDWKSTQFGKRALHEITDDFSFPDHSTSLCAQGRLRSWPVLGQQKFALREKKGKKDLGSPQNSGATTDERNGGFGPEGP